MTGCAGFVPGPIVMVRARAGEELDVEPRDREWIGWHITRVYAQADETGDSYSISYYTDPAISYIPHLITDPHGRIITPRDELHIRRDRAEWAEATR